MLGQPQLLKISILPCHLTPNAIDPSPWSKKRQVEQRDITTPVGIRFQKALSYVLAEFPVILFVPIVFCSGQYLQDSGSLSFIPPGRYLNTWVRLLWVCLLAEESQLFQPLLLWEMLQPFNHLCGPPLVSLQLCPSLLHWGAQNWTQHFRGISPVLIWGKQSFPLALFCK